MKATQISDNKIVRLKITLDDIKPVIWRRIGIVNLTCFEGILAFALTLALLQAIEFTEGRFLD